MGGVRKDSTSAVCYRERGDFRNSCSPDGAHGALPPQHLAEAGTVLTNLLLTASAAYF